MTVFTRGDGLRKIYGRRFVLLTATVFLGLGLWIHQSLQVVQLGGERGLSSIPDHVTTVTAPPKSDPQSIGEPVASPAPMRQEIAWILGHKNRWPKEVALLQQEEFPVNYADDLGSFVFVSAGTKAKVVEITPLGITLEFPHGREELPHEMTDLLTRVRAEMEKANPSPMAQSQDVTKKHSRGYESETVVPPSP